MRLAWVQLDEFSALAVRIFKNRKLAFESIESPKCIERALAISQIRRQIFARQDGVCLSCPEILTYSSMHMHEEIHRGQGGEISLDNSVGLCYNCHINIAHGNRRPQFSRRVSSEEWEPHTR